MEETKAEIVEQMLYLEFSREVVGTEETPILTIRKSSGDKQLVIYSSPNALPEDTNGERIPSLLVRDFVVKTLIEIIHRVIYPTVRILPTERTSFIAHPPGYKPMERDEIPNQEIISQGKLKIAPGGVGYFLSMMKTISELSGKKQRVTKDR